MALHELSLFPDYGVRHLLEAERMARVALLLVPSNRETQSLLAELLAIESEVEYDRSNYLSSDNLWDEATDFLKTSDNPQDAIRPLFSSAMEHYEAGKYRMAERIFRRIVIISSRANGPNNPDTLLFRMLHIINIGSSGRYFDALELSKAMLPNQEKVLDKEHPETLTTRNNIAALTGKTGDAHEALE